MTYLRRASHALSSVAAPLAFALPGALRAQAAPPPRQALAIGWSPAAGIVGVEYVRRPSRGGPLPVGFAAGAGILGVGARVHVGLRRGGAPARQRVPYVGAGYAANMWLDFSSVRSVTTGEAGVQFWPAARRRAYFDFGAGAALVTRDGGGANAGAVLRALVGVGF